MLRDTGLHEEDECVGSIFDECQIWIHGITHQHEHEGTASAAQDVGQRTLQQRAERGQQQPVGSGFAQAEISLPSRTGQSKTAGLQPAESDIGSSRTADRKCQQICRRPIRSGWRTGVAGCG